jgi:cysteinyl-tRNA synthetase
MSEKYLGEVFDIHTGGMDHIPIHHENEIAQGKGYCGKIPANYWMHLDFLQVNGGKMSKSLNNLYTLEELKQKGYLPEVYRMFNFSSHYKKPINFTFEAMESTKVALNRLKEGYIRNLDGTDNVDENVLNEFENRFLDAINDDLNMPQAMSVIWDLIKYDKKSPKIAKLLIKFDLVLGLNIDKKEEVKLPEEILNILEERKEARENKEWNKSDELRDKLKELGYIVKDTKDGQIVEKV